MHAIDSYLSANRAWYLDRAAHITPDLRNPAHVWARFALAILSAHTNFTYATKALAYAVTCKGNATRRRIKRFGITPDRADYLNALPGGRDILSLIRHDDESWDAHRARIRDTVPGLGYIKASFAVALLDPLQADIACLDTHMQGVYLAVPQAFRYTKSLPLYRTVEAKIRTVGQRHGVSTFLAQWAIWDHARGKREDHNIFPEG